MYMPVDVISALLLLNAHNHVVVKAACSSRLMLAPLNTVERHAFLYQLPQRAQLTEEADSILHRLQHIIDLALGCKASNTEADAAVSALVAIAKRSEDVAGFERSRGARATRG